MKSNQDYTAIILEEIRDQNKLVLEAIDTMPTRHEVHITNSNLKAIADDVKTIKRAVTDLSTIINHHERRLTQLEP